jgi:hypothetical protein
VRTPLLFLSACAFAAIAAGAEVSPIRLRVEQVASNQSEKFKHAQKLSLKLFLSNSGSADVGGLKVKYVFFGRKQEDQDISVVQRGERKASVEALATTTLETESANATYTEEHGERVNKGGGPNGNKQRKSGNVRFKTVEATGTKITGYGVQVFADGKMIAEAYSAPSLKERMK